MSSPAPIDLQTAITYGVLAGQSISNTGSTVINGNLGISPNGSSSVTGFPPGIVNGDTNEGNAAAAQAQSDLDAGIADAISRTADSTLVADIGGLTLAEGVYDFASSATVTGILTLDNTGPNQVWIFQIPSTLTMATSASVVFANPSNGGFVYWNVGSSATLGTTSTIIGAIMATISITAVTSATTENLLAKESVTLDGNTVNVQDDICYLKGTEIMAIKDGNPKMVKIEELRQNDTIVSFGEIKDDVELLYEDSLNRITWVGHYKVESPKMQNYPICFKKGSISENVPSKDVWVSQKHRVCINNLLTGAISLVNDDTIYIDRTVKNIEYYHLQTNKHQIINVSGILSETMDVPEGKEYKYKNLFTEL